MERGLILLISTIVVFVVPAVRGTAHLSFANNTEVNINRTGCGMTKLCLETPTGCDPAGNSSCLFTSLDAGTPMPPNGTNLVMELSGNSSGYIAVGLSANTSEGSTALFVCGQNNSMFFFRTLTRNNSNNMLSPSETIVTEIRGTVNGSHIQCEFNIPGANATTITRSSHAITFDILLGTGDVNGTTIGPLSVAVRSGPLNVTDPASNVATTAAPNAAAPTTAAPTTAAMTTSGARGSSTPHAVLLLLGVLTLFVLKTA